MLRNLNRSTARGRVCGTPRTGVLGSAIPSTGDNGAPPLYNDISLPADNDKEYRMRITTWPSGLTLFAYEDSSFIASGADGLYTIPYELHENGAIVGTSQFQILFGSSSGVLPYWNPPMFTRMTGNLQG